MVSGAKSAGAAIFVEGLVYSYPGGIPALRGVSFEVGAGERVGLIGPNGAGKSTLFLCLLGLLEGANGSARVAGIDVNGGKDMLELRRRTGLVFQDPDDQLFNPTVIEDAAFGPLNLGASEEEAVRRAGEALAGVGLPDELFSRPPHHLSAGQRRRVAMAGILAMEPEVILLDEPTSDLDPGGRKRLAGLLKSLPQAMMVASHDLEFVLSVCSRVLLLDSGVVAARGDPRDVMADVELMESHGLEKPHSLVPHGHNHGT